MRAIVINHYGGREELVQTNMEIPEVGADDVLIKVEAAAVNPVDIAIREGYLRDRLSAEFPMVLGYDASGVIVKAGKNVTDLREGIRVYTYQDLNRQGAYAEYVAVQKNLVSEMPSNLSFEEAASIPLAGITAWRGLNEAGIKAGDRVLIIGGSGGVGTLAIQLAKSFGAIVTATTSTANMQLAADLGAEEVIDYKKEDFHLRGPVYDVVFDTVGGEEFTKGLKTVKTGGSLVSIAAVPGEEQKAFAKENGIQIKFIISNPSGDILRQLTRYIENGQLKPVINKVYSLSQVSEAHEHSESGRAKGKIIIKMGELKMMKAVMVDPNVKNSLELTEIDVPKIASHEVLVRITAAAMNHRDLYMNNEWSALKGYEKFIAGGDGAGVIVEVGSAVDGWKAGDEVVLNPLMGEDDGPQFPEFLGGPNDGTFAEYVKVPAEYILKKPAYLSFEEAAAVPLGLSTAWGNVVTQGKLLAGETLLLQGIGGGVATFILQLAVAKGVKVIVTSSSAEKIDRAIKMGAIAGINYKTENVAERVMELTNGKGADAVVDGSGKDSIESSVNSLAANGRLLHFGGSTGPVSKALIESIAYISTGMVSQSELKEALEFYEKHQMRPVLSQTQFTLEQYKQAYEELQNNQKFGKIVILPA